MNRQRQFNIVNLYCEQRQREIIEDFAERIGARCESVSVEEFINSSRLPQADAYLIDTNSREETLFTVLTKIRNNDTSYLTPVVAYGENSTHRIRQNVEQIGLNEPEKVRALIEKTYEFWQGSGQIPGMLSPQDKTKLRFLRFLLCRNIKELLPYPNKESLIGYEYPWATPFWETPEVAFNNLMRLLNAGIFNGELADKINFCPRCQSWAVVIRDICPKCGSLDIEVTEMVHHFRCATVAPIQEFLKGESLICPKCHQELRHIGLDYDKPSDLYYCYSCQERFTDPEYQALCHNCGATCDVAELGQRRIFRLFVTNAIYAEIEEIIKGVETTEKKSAEDEYISEEFLNLIFQKEVYRSRRYKKSFGLIIFNGFGDEQIPPESRKYEKIIRMMKECIYHSLRKADMIFAYKPGIFVILLPETNWEGTRIVTDRLREAFQKYTELLQLHHTSWRISASTIDPNTQNAEMVLKNMLEAELKV